MPTDASGVYSLPDGYLAVTGTTVLASQHNPPLEDLAESMTQRMMRSGVTPMTGQMKLDDGTVLAPGITMASAPSSGWYKTADGWGFSIGGVQVAEITAAGIRSGARYIGELIPFSGLTAQALTVFPYGQTLSRTTYAALWAFAQTEIAAGNTFYNNGNGSTTFGIGDLRGRTLATKDNLGGVAASRLTTARAGVDGATMGAAGGSPDHTLTLTQLPGGITSTLSGTASVTSASSNVLQSSGPPDNWSSIAGATSFNNQTRSAITSSGPISGSATSNNTGGLAHPIAQPTIVATHLLFAGA
jgi:microcystin-dependent protein